MGSPDGRGGARPDERPLHRVSISKPFFIGRYEVTVGQYVRFVNATGYVTVAERNGKGGWRANGSTSLGKQSTETNWRNPGFEQTAEHPVTLMAWDDAVAFCEWLSKKEKRRYRLPTEAEWEYACRAGNPEGWSDSRDTIGDYAWYLTNSRIKTWPVGQRLPNHWGIHDVFGNVREWCSDWYAPDYYGESVTENSGGAASGDAGVIRGGCFMDLPPFLRFSWRGQLPPDLPLNNQGFRVVREADERD